MLSMMRKQEQDRVAKSSSWAWPAFDDQIFPYWWRDLQARWSRPVWRLMVIVLDLNRSLNCAVRVPTGTRTLNEEEDMIVEEMRFSQLKEWMQLIHHISWSISFHLFPESILLKFVQNSVSLSLCSESMVSMVSMVGMPMILGMAMWTHCKLRHCIFWTNTFFIT